MQSSSLAANVESRDEFLEYLVLRVRGNGDVEGARGEELDGIRFRCYRMRAVKMTGDVLGVDAAEAEVTTTGVGRHQRYCHQHQYQQQQYRQQHSQHYNQQQPQQYKTWQQHQPQGQQ